MTTKRISQREARSLRARVQKLTLHLKNQRYRYASEWPGGVCLGTFLYAADDARASAVHTARRLKHAVVAVDNGEREFKLFAIPFGELP